jgi:hypothetical protein
MKKVFAFTLLLSTVLVVYSCQLQQHVNTLPASIFITNMPSGYRTVNNSNQRRAAVSPLLTFTAHRSRYVTRLCWYRCAGANEFILCAETSQRLVSGYSFQPAFAQQKK